MVQDTDTMVNIVKEPDGDGQFGLCRRCATDQAILKVRQDNLCKDCFLKYVNTKVVKRMEAFRVRTLEPGKARKLLLPLSLGLSSSALLHILSGHLEGQMRNTGRPGYSVHVVHVLLDAGPERDGRWIQKFRDRYPQHEFSTVPIHGELEAPLDDLTDTTRSFGLASLLSSLTAPSSHSDIGGIALRQRIVSVAQQLNCEGILWGDTTTSLAEKVLAETAKGRGFALPWLANDGQSPLGIPFYFPMKDLLRKEILPFVELVGMSPDLVSLGAGEKPKPASTKNASIDGLMKEYFQSVEENYPSIVANVVRTSSKLQAQEIDENTESCTLCKMLVEAEDSGPAESRYGATHASRTSRSPLCYGCRTSLGSLA